MSQNRVSQAGCVSGSVKPLPPFKPNQLAIAYQERYLALVVAAAKAYGSSTRFFLACGPMASDYCSEVAWVIKQTNAVGIKSYLLNQVCLPVCLLSTGVHHSLPPSHPCISRFESAHADEPVLHASDARFFNLRLPCCNATGGI